MKFQSCDKVSQTQSPENQQPTTKETHMKPLLTIILTILITACSKAPINSDVEGFWQLDEFQILSTGETVECTRLYYSISRMVTEVSERQGPNGYGAYIGRTAYSDDGNTLILTDFKERGGNAGTGDNKVDAPVEQLRHYGINSQKETKFRIVRCDGRSMVLESDYARLELSKF